MERPGEVLIKGSMTMREILWGGNLMLSLISLKMRTRIFAFTDRIAEIMIPNGELRFQDLIRLIRDLVWVKTLDWSILMSIRM